MDLSPFYCIILIILFLVSFCASDDRLIPGKPLSPGYTVVSNGGSFALGFFSPTNSNTSLYVGIWYKNIPRRTVVWVANRDRPITDASSASLAVTNQSNLVVSDSNGGVLWTTNVTSGFGVMAVLLNTGNLVLRSPSGRVLWQSFDYPTDTFLPGMKLRLSHKTHVAERIISWKGPQDPATGYFSFGADPNNSLQLFVWHGPSPYGRSRVWTGSMVAGIYQANTSSIVYRTIIATDDEIYLTFTVSDDSSYARSKLDYTGQMRLLSWNGTLSEWTTLAWQPPSNCDQYGSCGPFGYCDDTAVAPTCKCLEGFAPNSEADWTNGNFSQGCRRKEALTCGGGEDFLTVPGMKVPDRFLILRNTSFDECAAECRSNCSCLAYAYANLSSGGGGSVRGDTSRCLVWTGELIDTGTIGDFGENIYLRLAGLEGSSKKSSVVKIVVPVLAGILILTCICLVWSCKLKGKRRNKVRLVLGDLSAFDELGEGNPANSLEIPFIRFEDIVVATKNFSNSNMLGQGGFGKVYKGLLEGGKEVAVKRLSRGSGQGREEFRNEVVLIAKLQHRNLVRLLGCCIQGDEKLLIYEYLPNKSLDAFLFNAARKSVLDWPIRFKIIKGVAKGLLYLHQDSRLTIIHRDLKASNILLDADMSPKISDFGMARIFGGNQQQANTNRVVGTYGYMSPEYAMEGVFSVKSDVYSFGVLLLEIVSGLKISSPHLIMDFPNLIAYAWSLWKEGKAKDLVDSSVVESCSVDEALRCIHIALLCVQDNPSARPLMSSVVFMLENGSTALPTPKQPLYFSQRNHETESMWDNIQNSVNTMTLTILEGR